MLPANTQATYPTRHTLPLFIVSLCSADLHTHASLGTYSLFSIRYIHLSTLVLLLIVFTYPPPSSYLSLSPYTFSISIFPHIQFLCLFTYSCSLHTLRVHTDTSLLLFLSLPRSTPLILTLFSKIWLII